MNPATVALITALLQLAVQEEPIVVEQILKIKQMLTQSPDVVANLTKLRDDAIADDDATIQEANDWLQLHGFNTIQN